MKAYKFSNLTVEEYIKQESETNTKYEYHNGKIYALAGGTLNHGLICGNVFGELRSRLKEKNSKCLPLNTDVKLFIKKTNSYVYPDTMVICGEIEMDTNEPNAVTNPVLIIEVLSKSTAEYDRGDKFHLYRQIPSFREYVIIDQKKHTVDVHYKPEQSDLWKITRFEGIDSTVRFQSIELDIPMKDLYYRTNLEVPE